MNTNTQPMPNETEAQRQGHELISALMPLIERFHPAVASSALQAAALELVVSHPELERGFIAGLFECAREVLRAKSARQAQQPKPSMH